MNTLDQYLPAVKEAPGRLYFPGHAVIGVVLGVALLVGAGSAALRYPAKKTAQAVQLLADYGQRTAQSIQGANAALQRTQALLVDQPEWLQKSTLDQIARLQAKLQKLPAQATPESAIAAATKRKEAYDQARQLIAASPFRDLDDKQVPLTAEGKALLEARKVQPPDRFRYQQLMTGATGQLDALRSALRLQGEAETLAHRIDVRVNGDKAQPLGEQASLSSDAPDQSPDSDDDVDPNDRDAVKARIMELFKRAKEAENARNPRSSIEPAASPASSLGRDPSVESGGGVSTSPAPVDPVAAAEAKAQVQQREAQRQAAAAEAKAKRDAERAERDTQRQAQAQQREAERAQQEQARQAAAAEREAQRQADAAKRAEEAKRRECTASLVARLRCTKDGYNPITGRKKATGE